MSDKKDSPLQIFCSAGIGAAFAELSTLPIDIAKVRLQTQKPLPDGTMLYRNMFQGMLRIRADEGAAALWKGAVPALMRQISYTGLSFVLYEPIRESIIGQPLGDGPGQIKKEDVPAWKLILAGGVAGGTSIVCVNPTDVVKTQMQSATDKPNMGSLAQRIVKNEGVLGLWRGWQPNVARCFIGNACEIGCYDVVKTSILAKSSLEDGPSVHLASSSAAGIVSAIFSTPVDVVKTRLMNQAGSVAGSGKTEGLYSGVVDCFLRMPREEGITSLYRGFFPLAARKILWTVAYFMMYEQARGFVTGSYST